MTTRDPWARTIEVAEPKAKRPKPDGETKPTKPASGVMKPFTEQQREMVAKVIAAITNERTALDDVTKEFSGKAAEYLPAPIQKKVELASSQAEMTLAELAMVAAPNREGTFKDVLAKNDCS